MAKYHIPNVIKNNLVSDAFTGDIPFDFCPFSLYCTKLSTPNSTLYIMPMLIYIVKMTLMKYVHISYENVYHSFECTVPCTVFLFVSRFCFRYSSLVLVLVSKAVCFAGSLAEKDGRCPECPPDLHHSNVSPIIENFGLDEELSICGQEDWCSLSSLLSFVLLCLLLSLLDLLSEQGTRK